MINGWDFAGPYSIIISPAHQVKPVQTERAVAYFGGVFRVEMNVNKQPHLSTLTNPG